MSDELIAPVQKTYIEAFSKEGIDSYYGALYPYFFKMDRDLYRDLKLANYIAGEMMDSDKNFDVYQSNIGSNVVEVKLGSAVINGTVITIEEETSLNLINDSDYIYDTDSEPTSQHAHDIYVVLRYKPTELDNNAYIGLVNDASLMENDLDYIVVLGIVHVTGNGTTMNTGGTIGTAETEPNGAHTYRPIFPYNYFDGGTI